MSETSVDIHIPGKTPDTEAAYVDPKLNDWGRATLAEAVLAEQLPVTFTRGGSSFLETTDDTTRLRDEVKVLRPVAFERDDGKYLVRVQPEVVAVSSLKAIRNVAAVLGHGVPELNHPDLRAITRDKAVTNTVLQGLGLAKRFAVIAPGDNIEERLAAFEAQAVVIKPRTGKQGIGVVPDKTKPELVRMAAEGEIDRANDLIIEERLDMSPPMPVRGVNEDEQAKIDAANRNGAAKELRAYYFGENAAGEPQIHFVLRVAKPDMKHLHHDDWVFIDQDSVPDELYGMTAMVADSFRAASKTNEIHIGVDWARARSDDGSAYWVPMEINGGEPQLVYEDEHRETALIHARLLASQLKRVAQNGIGTYTA